MFLEKQFDEYCCLDMFLEKQFDKYSRLEMFLEKQLKAKILSRSLVNGKTKMK